jgi:hypothetical protein
MAGETSGGDRFIGLPLRPAPPRRWRRPPRYRVGPLRKANEAVAPAVLTGMRSGAIAGLAIVTVLGLPVLLILGAKAPAPSAFEPPARVWAAAPEADAPVRAWAEPSGTPALAPIAAAFVEPSPARGGSAEPPGKASADRSALSLDLIPVLDDESGTLSVEEPPVPVVKPVRTSRAPAGSRLPKAP